MPSLQDGNGEVCQTSDPSRGLVLFPGSLGCLSTCTDAEAVSGLPSFGLDFEGGLPFYGPTLRSLYSAAGVHQDRHGSCRSSQATGTQGSRLPGRLDLSVARSQSSGSSPARYPQPHPRLRISGERGEVPVTDCSAISVSGTPLRHSATNSSTCRSSDRQADYVHLGRLHRRPVQFWLRRLWSQRQADLDCLLPVDLDLVTALRQWLDREWLLRGVPLVPLPTTLTICTDASLEGWGSSLGGHMLSGTWPKWKIPTHINWLELRAVLLALRGFAHLISGQCVLLLTDNSSTVSYLRKQGGLHSVDLYDLTREVYLLTERLGVNLVVRHIPSKRNVLADALSRSSPLATEWKLNTDVFQLLQSLAPLSIDLFATRLNNQLPVFVCPFPDEEAVAADALSIPWTFQSVMYAFPPSVLLPQVLSKIRSERVPLVLVVAPLHPRQTWFTDMIELSLTHAIRLPLLHPMLAQAHWVHENPSILHLHAWMLSGDHSLGLAILRQSSPGWLRAVDHPRTLSTMASGKSTRIGANLMGSVLSIPLAHNYQSSSSFCFGRKGFPVVP